jgi:hypothetical protein
MDFALVELRVILVAQFIRDRPRRDRTEQLAVLAGLYMQHQRELAQRRSQLAHCVQFLGFAVHSALLQRFDLPLVRRGERNRQALGKKIIARVTRRHFHMVRFGPEADYIVSQNNFSLWHFILL